MLPISIAVATCAVTSGIGGAALFGPLFLIIFPIMGPQYVISSPRGSVALAILIETFGFGSGEPIVNTFSFIAHEFDMQGWWDTGVED